jgi:GNAT superfamily N-acetyltransferase
MNANGDTPYPFIDRALARRLESAEGRGNADFVETRAKVFPQSGAQWIEVAGAHANYDGATSPTTQTFGLGLFAEATRADLERIEAFFRERGAPVCHEVSPLADLSLLALLNERGYQPFEFTSVMFRPIQRGVHLAVPPNERIQVRLAQADEYEQWAHTAAKGWSEFKEFADIMFEMARVSAARADGLSFMAELDGQPIATGAMSICEGVALLAGASTIPEARKQGAQLALLASRLSYAAEHGCDLAMMCAAPGSSSQRNAERQGFRIAYTRIKWRLPERPASPLESFVFI